MVCGPMVSTSASGGMAASIGCWRNLGAAAAGDNHRIAKGNFLLPERRRDVAAVYGRHVAGGFQLQRLVQEGLRHVLGGDLAAEQIAAHVVLLRDAAGLGALLDEVVGEESRAD